VKWNYLFGKHHPVYGVEFANGGIYSKYIYAYIRSHYYKLYRGVLIIINN